MQTCKPDSVSNKSEGYHLSVPPITQRDQSAYPVPCANWKRRPADEQPLSKIEGYYTWHFSMQGLPANDITIISRELLPHVFTRALWLRRAVIFCGTISSAALQPQSRLFTGALLCAVRTFLPDRNAGTIAWFANILKSCLQN